jgi:hypothetical protein
MYLLKTSTNRLSQGLNCVISCYIFLFLINNYENKKVFLQMPVFSYKSTKMEVPAGIQLLVRKISSTALSVCLFSQWIECSQTSSLPVSPSYCLKQRSIIYLCTGSQSNNIIFRTERNNFILCVNHPLFTR